MEVIIGKIFITNSGDKFKVLNKSEKQYYYNIEFLDTKFIKSATKQSILKGKILDNSKELKINLYQNYKSKNCGYYKILEYLGKSEDNRVKYYKIKFIKTGFECKVTNRDIKLGNIFDKLFPTICNIGFYGEGKYSWKNNLKIYNCWIHLLNRCYNKNDNNFKNYGEKGVTVCEEWHNFQNFAKWYEENSIFNINCQLDKDILCYINNFIWKIYSPNTCLLIPEELNCFLAGDSISSGVWKRKDTKKDRYVCRFNNKDCGTFDTFREAKLTYCNYKIEKWMYLLDMYKDIINNNELYNILKQYDFYKSKI